MPKAKPKPKEQPKTEQEKKPFVQTFKRLKDMSESERNAFDQGCITANNNVKERLGFRKEREKK